MNNYKTALLIILSILAFSLLNGQPSNRLDIALEVTDLPVASSDNMFAPYANPALLGTGNIAGTGWAHAIQNSKLQNQYWFFVNMDGLSYVYENLYDASKHNLAAGWELFSRHTIPNLYGGVSYKWTNSAFGKGFFRSGLLYRPHNSTSLAFTWDNPYKDSPSYSAGVSLRPLAFISPQNDYRIEGSLDMNYAKNATGDYEFLKPVIGINTQLLDGINLGATYNMESETAFLNFSLAFGRDEIGTAALAKDGEKTALIAYYNSADLSFKPFLGITGKKWYKLNLKGEVVTYKGSKYSIGPVKVFDSNQITIDNLIANIRKAQNEKGIQGILLVNPSFSTSFALQQELIGALQEFKACGKKISTYFDNISNGGYAFAASIADNIYLNPMGTLDLRGISITSPYIGALLDTIGIDVMNFRSHKYKSAGNMFSEDAMTEAEREVYDSILQSIYDQMIAQINAGRGDKLRKPVEDLIDGGPYFLAQEALDEGLVDKLIFEDELEKLLKDTDGFSAGQNEIADYRDYSWYKPKESLIAVIYATGSIVMGKGESGKMIAHDTTVKQIRAARKNKNYKGIILRVDSGGGSAQASDIIMRELTLAQTENKKPVVVSMAGVAASGGYYISCNADRIIADPSTLTGSIGVIGISFNAKRMFEKVRINWSTVSKGRNADFGSMYRDWTDTEKERMSSHIETVYEDFVKKVDAGRDELDLEQVHEYAQGRVWTGEQAKELGLIDDLGGMDVALEHIRELTNITGKIRLVNATGSHSGFNVSISGDPLSVIPVLSTLNELERDYLDLYEMWSRFKEGEALMLSPLKAPSMDF
jgi:protease-4